MGQNKTPKQLSKFISYVLGRRPDEFGLVPDPDGYVKIKELLKALWEEHGWKYVRRSHLAEILLTLSDPPIEIQGGFIRSKDRNHLPKPIQPQTLPKLLYTCIRKKAYPVVVEKGIPPMGHAHVVLSSRRHMAERIGKRYDPDPVLLTIRVEKSVSRNVLFYQAGESIYLAATIPPGCFTGPPLPKQKLEPKKQDIPKDQEDRRLAGTFQVDLEGIQKRNKTRGRKKEVPWKNERMHMKKEKQRRRRR